MILKLITSFFDFRSEEEKLDDNIIYDKLLFVQTKAIKHKDEHRSGLIENIELAKGEEFREIILTTPPHIIDKKQGIAKVKQELELEYENSNNIFDILKELKAQKKTISVLHINTLNNKCSLFGENNGMNIIELSETKILLKGEEEDIFYNVSTDFFNKINK